MGATNSALVALSIAASPVGGQSNLTDNLTQLIDRFESLPETIDAPLSEDGSSSYRGDWPPCPAKGCLPCPANAGGRPNCACTDGHVLRRNNSAAAGGQLLTWDEVRGWLGECVSVSCGPPPVFPHTTLQSNESRDKAQHGEILFGQRTTFLCDIGYTVERFDSASVSTNNSRSLIQECRADGAFHNLTGAVCEPECGDGRLVPTDHLPLYDPREQCDDGNSENSDGCNAECRVESGFVCNGGGPQSADSCWDAGLYADSVLVLSISGRRVPSLLELSSATSLALAYALQCRERDLEITDVVTPEIATMRSEVSDTGVSIARTDEGSSTKPNVSDGSFFHADTTAVQIAFRVKISRPSELSIDSVRNSLLTPAVMLPKLWLAYMDLTSLHDLYVTVVEIRQPAITGDLSRGRPPAFSLAATLTTASFYLGPVIVYALSTCLFFPYLWYLMRIRRRKYRLMGRFDEVSPEFKGAWAFNICSWVENKCLFCALVCLLPSRLADTWDAAGLVPYWRGVRRAACCCTMYLLGCGFCAAIIPGQMRSELRDFFGFGDGTLGNLEMADYCCYLCCPLPCVVQEARHVDAALQVLPAPVQQRTLSVQVKRDLDKAKKALDPVNFGNMGIK